MCPPSMNKDGKTCNYDKCMAYMGDLYYPRDGKTGCNATGCNCKSVGGRFGSTAKNAHDNTANRSKTEIEQFEAINTNFGSCAGGKQEAESCYLTPNGDDPLKMCTSDGTNHTCSNPWYTEKCINATCTSDQDCQKNQPRSTCIGGKCMVVEQDSALRYQVKPAMTTSMQCRVPLEFTGQACTSSDDCNWDETCEFNKTTKQNECQKFKYTTPCKTTDDCTTGTCEANVDNNCDFSAGEDYSTMQSNLLDQLRDDMHMMCGLSQKEIVTRNVAMGSGISLLVKPGTCAKTELPGESGAIPKNLRVERVKPVRKKTKQHPGVHGHKNRVPKTKTVRPTNANRPWIAPQCARDRSKTCACILACSTSSLCKEKQTANAITATRQSIAKKGTRLRRTIQN